MIVVDFTRGLWTRLRRAWTRAESDEVAPGEQYAEWESLEGVHAADDDVPSPDHPPIR